MAHGGNPFRHESLRRGGLGERSKPLGPAVSLASLCLWLVWDERFVPGDSAGCGGRLARLAGGVAMNAPVVGIDLGGTKLAAARLVGTTLTPATVVRTELSSSDAVLDQVVEVCEAVVASDTVAVGVGVPSVVDFATGAVRSSVNIPLAGIPLRQILSERLGLPVYVDNDASCAALAEAWEGDRLAIADLVMFTVGTGVGGGLVLGGRIYRGATGAAGELGQTLISSDASLQAGDSHPFPKPGSLEELASGRALDRLTFMRASARPDSPLGRPLAQGKPVAARDAVDAARAGDPDGQALVRLVGERLGVGVANAINTFDPQVVAIGGGLAVAGKLLLEPVEQVARRLVLPGVGTVTEIRLSRFGSEGGLLGAALLAAQEFALAQGSGAPRS